MSNSGLPPFASPDMALPFTTVPGPYVTEPARELPGTGADTVASGAGPALDIRNTEALTTAQVQDAPAFESVGYTRLPETSTGPNEKRDIEISNGTAPAVGRPADAY